MACFPGAVMKLIFWIMVFFIISPFIVGAQDVATEHTQVLNNIELITENIRQLQSLYNQIEMIKNQVEGLNAVATYQNNFVDTDSLRMKLADIINEGVSFSDQTQSLLTRMQQESNNLTSDGTMLDQQNSLGELLSEQISMQAAMINKENQEKQDMDNKVDQIIHPIENASSSFDLGS